MASAVVEVTPVTWSQHGSFVRCFGYREDGSSLCLKIKCMETARFFEQKGIRPYAAFQLISPKFGLVRSPLIHSQQNLSLLNEASIQSSREDTPMVPLVTLYWDIEVHSETGEFPQASRLEDRVFMISAVITRTNQAREIYLLTTELTNISEKYQTQYFESEAELIQGFWQLLDQVQPDRLLTFYGDGFDIPYLIERTHLHSLTFPGGRLRGVSAVPQLVEQMRFGSRIAVWTLPLEGIEQIDLLTYYRRFHPTLQNHKLDTVSTHFLQRGKVGLAPGEMHQAVQTKDIELLNHLASYSVQDSILLADLWNQVPPLEELANTLRWTIAEVLNRPLREMMFVLCGDAIQPGKKCPWIQPISPGIYTQVYVYNYLDLYFQLMKKSTLARVRNLPNRIGHLHLPPDLIVEICQSSYVNVGELHRLFEEVFEYLFGRASDLLEITSTQLYVLQPITEPWARLEQIIPSYIVLTEASRILRTSSAEFIFQGTASLCRNPFSLTRHLLAQYLDGADLRTLDLSLHSVEDFLLTKKLTPWELRAPRKGRRKDLGPSEDPLLQQWEAQHGSSLLTWTKVRYLVTLEGPQLYDPSIHSASCLDYDYYQNLLQKQLRILRALPSSPP